MQVEIQIPNKLVPVFEGEADVRGSYGGRGSAKTRTFAKMTAIRAYMWDQAGREGSILCGRQFMNSLDDSSMEEIKQAIKDEPWLEKHFDIGERYIRTKSRRINYIFSGLDRNIASVKSKSRILLCWVDEAEAVTDYAWTVLIPTIREVDSELWVTWNPEKKGSATDSRFRNSKDKRYKIMEMNHSDNPWFPPKLNRDRLRDIEERPEDVDWIWEGGYRTAFKGAYFVKRIREAREDNRIGMVGKDPLMTVKLFADIGGTGAKSDNFVFWAAQYIGTEIRVIDHYEAQGQDLAAHLAWLRERGYTPDNAEIVLPHDGSTNDKVFNVSYESALKSAGYKVTVVPNQGKGAAKARIEEVRRLFPSIRINEESCEAGIEALSFYHEKQDEVRGIGLGPDHDWSSHSADAFGLMCVAHKTPKKNRPLPKPRIGIV